MFVSAAYLLELDTSSQSQSETETLFVISLEINGIFNVLSYSSLKAKKYITVVNNNPFDIPLAGPQNIKSIKISLYLHFKTCSLTEAEKIKRTLRITKN